MVTILLTKENEIINIRCLTQHLVQLSHPVTISSFLLPLFTSILILFFNCSLHSILCCISFRCITAIRQSYTSQCSPDISSTHQAPYRVITLLSVIFHVLYFTSLWLLSNWHFVLLHLFHQVPHPPPLWQSSVYSTSFWGGEYC